MDQSILKVFGHLRKKGEEEETHQKRIQNRGRWSWKEIRPKRRWSAGIRDFPGRKGLSEGERERSVVIGK